jgi:6-pyruvoyltetrahydropterin/6-carboxytetrahydropterin synthase
MMYRICKAFEVESGHMLSKHPDRCRFPHGHSRRIEVVIASEALDEHDMVCDFAALKLTVKEAVDRFDHSMAVNSEDPVLGAMRAIPALGERLVVFPGKDPTTEVLAKSIYDQLTAAIASGGELTGPTGRRYTLPRHLIVERVRVGETSSSWAEYGR